MTISPIQIVLLVFLLFAISRVVLRLKDGNLKTGEFYFWFSIFGFAIVGVIDPGFTTYLAQLLGIGRGADVVIYASLALLFYLIFRTNIHLEETKHEITKLVRLLALQEQTEVVDKK